MVGVPGTMKLPSNSIPRGLGRDTCKVQITGEGDKAVVQCVDKHTGEGCRIDTVIGEDRKGKPLIAGGCILRDVERRVGYLKNWGAELERQ